MEDKSKPIKFEDLGLSTRDRLKLPSRRGLSSKPWSDDVTRQFHQADGYPEKKSKKQTAYSQVHGIPHPTHKHG